MYTAFKNCFFLILIICFCAAPALAVVELDVHADADVEDYSDFEDSGGVLDGIPDRISNTNALSPAKGILSDKDAIEDRGIMVFDIGDYAGQTLVSATLTGWGYRTDHIAEGSIDVQVAAYAGDGAVTLADFDTEASNVGTFTFPKSDFLFPDVIYHRFEVDVTSIVQQFLSDSENYVEFRFTADELSAYISAGETAAARQLDSRTPGYPKLILNFTPHSTPAVKIDQTGPDGAAQLRTDYDGDGIYEQFFIQGVGYSPVPIGRAGMQWGGTNIFDDEDILRRDFQLLSDMNANTIRIWKADDTNPPNNEFPNYMTARTLDIAEEYDLKVIAGFWLGFGGYWQCGPDGREFIWDGGFFDLNGGQIRPSVRGDIMYRWKSFIREFKDHPAILFWSIGNENNYQLGNDRPDLVEAFYGLINDMVFEAKRLDPNHPVAFINGGIDVPVLVGDQEENKLPEIVTTIAPNVDIWGINMYSESLEGTFNRFHNEITDGSKALWVSEFGIDAWHSDRNDDEGGYEDQAAQAQWDGDLWDEIVDANTLGVIGGTVMAYSDEWWKPYQWMCQVPGWPQWWRSWWEFLDSNGGLYPCGVFNETHDLYGIGPSDSDCDGVQDWFPVTPDEFFNEEWWGIVKPQRNLTAGEPDVMVPREAYATLQEKFLLGLDAAGLSITPDSGSFGDIVVITGKNFGEYLADTKYNPEADLDRDGNVEFSDIRVFSQSYGRTFGQPGFNASADLNHDTFVDLQDLIVLVRSYHSSMNGTYVKFSPASSAFAKIISWTDNEIVCQVPFGVETGDVVVHASSGESEPEVFTAQEGLRVDSLLPLQADLGDKVSILGAGFGDQQGSRFVEFKGMEMSDIIRWSDNEIVFKVAANAETGNGNVYLVTDVQRVLAGSFEATQKLVITGISHNLAAVGDSFEIYGRGFKDSTIDKRYNPAANLNHDDKVDYDDMVIWADSFKTAEGEARYSAAADLDHDHDVDIDDFIIFSRSFHSTRGPNYVVFNNNVEARIISWNDSKIVCEVPYGAQSGDIMVVVGDESKTHNVNIP